MSTNEHALTQRLPLMSDKEIKAEREKLIRSITLDTGSMVLRRMALSCSRELAKRRLADELMIMPRR